MTGNSAEIRTRDSSMNGSRTGKICSMGQNPPSEADSHSIFFLIPRFLWNTGLLCRVHKTLQWRLFRARHIQPISLRTDSLISILILFWHLRLGSPVGLVHSDFPTALLLWAYSPIRITSPPHAILLDLIIVIIIGEDYKFCSSCKSQYSAFWVQIFPSRLCT
jgi:hypothetical protein